MRRLLALASAGATLAVSLACGVSGSEPMADELVAEEAKAFLPCALPRTSGTGTRVNITGPALEAVFRVHPSEAGALRECLQALPHPCDEYSPHRRQSCRERAERRAASADTPVFAEVRYRPPARSEWRCTGFAHEDLRFVVRCVRWPEE